MIHPTAVVNPKADIDSSVEIGPYAIIRENVTIGAGTVIGPHAVIEPFVTIGPNCEIFQFAAVGAIPQSMKFKGEKTYVKIGRETIIREFATIHRGTGFGGGITEIGEKCFIMAYAHIAHDCRLGREVVLANNATLGGHITIGDHATLGGLVAIHQFVHVGDFAFIGGLSGVPKDVPPYVIAAGPRIKLHGINIVGLKRHGFSDNAISLLKKTYRLIFRIGLTLNEAVERVRAEVDQIPEVVNFVNFITSSQRGVTR
jgi:UDP-N-acetylglucosamine acyltransferase